MSVQAYSPVTEQTVEELQKLIGASNVSADLEKRIAYSYDEVLRFYWDKEYIAEVVVFRRLPRMSPR